jgi:hypothetical protein
MLKVKIINPCDIAGKYLTAGVYELPDECQEEVQRKGNIILVGEVVKSKSVAKRQKVQKEAKKEVKKVAVKKPRAKRK